MRPHVWYETAKMIADEYRAGAETRERDAAWWAAEGHPFFEVLDRVGHARMANGQRHPHQRRLTRAAIDGCVAALAAIGPQLEQAGRFYEVHLLVETAFKPVYGAGELAAYDAADRICERLGHVSEHIVYLHAGTRVGARRLFGGRLPRGDAWGIFPSQVPEAFREFSTHGIEDILCIYKDDLLLTPDQLRAKWEARAPTRCAPPAEPRATC